MAIPLDTVVSVSLTISPTPMPLAGFGQLLFVSPEANVKIPELEVVRAYSSIDEVAADFPTGEVNKAATAYYGQQPKPISFMVGGIYGVDTSAQLTGGTHGSLTDIQALTSADFSMPVDGTTVSATGVDFSGAADFAEVAAILQTALTGTNVLYESGTSAFVVYSATTGATSTLGYAAGDVMSAFGLTAGDGGLIIDGAAADGLGQALSRIEEANNLSYGVMLDKQYRDTDAAMEAAEWCQARKKVFFNTSNDANCLVKLSTDDIMYKMKAKGLGRTLSQYSSFPDEYPSASIAGRGFTVNFEGTNTAITLKFKKQPTISVEAKLTSGQLATLEQKNGNAFIDLGGFFMYSDSRMGDGGWFDTVHGFDWLQNRLQVDVFNLLATSPTKLPYTEDGVLQVINAMRGGFNQALRNGLIAPGAMTDGEYLTLGYEIEYVPVAETSPSDKGNRLYRGITFKCVGAGALHNIVITGTVTS